MATTFVDYTGDGNATKSFSFPSIKEADIKVEVDEVIKSVGNHFNITGYSTTGGGNVVFTSGNIPSSPARIRIFRDTDVDSAKATFTAGSSVKAGDLNSNNKQLLYSAQEEQNQTIQTSKIKDSAVTTAKIRDLNVTTAKIANDAVTADKLPDDVINSEHYAPVSIDTEHIANENVTTAKLANLAVTTSKLADANVTTAKIAPDNITNALIADNQIDSEHYVDGSIDRVHLEADIIDGTKLADNAVDSEHYTDGSIDRVHLEADIIDSTKLADNAVNSEHYVDGSIDHVHLANDIIDGDNIQDDVINSEHYVAGSIDHEHLANDIIDGDNIQDDVVNSEHIAAGALDNEHYAAGSITSDKLNGATVITSSEQASATTNDTSFLTSAAADARFFNISTGDTIKDGATFPDNDTTIATTAAINDRIIDLVDDVGGFVPITNETSFPTSNPDINNPATGGTIVSVSAASTNLAPSGTTVTIANGRGSGLAVIITGVPVTIPSGFGFLVETTTTDHTYAFHRLVPKATEVTTVAANATNIAAAGANTANINSVVANASNVNTVAGNISNVNTVGGISANVTTVAGISSNVTTVANNNANVTAVAGNNSNITAVADNETNINAVKNNATNINTVAGINSNVTAVAGNASNINSAVSNASNINSAVSNASNINSAVSNASNINTVAGSISNVNTAATNIANINTTATNIADVNNFAGTYQIASSAPTTDGSGNALAEGDLYFDTSSDELRVYNGSSWQGGVTAGTGFAGSGANTFTGDQTIQSTEPKLIFNDTNHNSDFRIKVESGQFDIDDTSNSNATRFRISSNGTVLIPNNLDAAAGIDVTGNITVTGNVDGRDVAADGTKLDGIASSSTANPNAIDNVVEDTSPQLGGTLDTNGNNIQFGNSEVAQFGNSQEFQMWHDGTNSHIKNATGAGIFQLRTDNFRIVDAAVQHTYLTAVQNGAVELYHDNDMHFATTATGVKTNGDLSFRGDGDSQQILFDAGDGSLKFNDSTKIKLGAGDDLQIYHNGTNNYLDSINGHLYLRVNSTENAIKCTQNGSVEISYDGSKKLETVSTGTQIVGDLTFSGATSKAIRLGDNNRIYFGAGEDFWIGSNGSNGEVSGSLFYYNNQHYYDGVRLRLGHGSDLDIYHDGTNSVIDNNTNDLIIRSDGDDVKILAEDDIVLRDNDDSTNFIHCINGGSVDLYYNGSKKFETTSNGIKVGSVTIDSGFNNIGLPDNGQVRCGAGEDLRIYHDGTNSYVSDVGTGNLKLTSSGAGVEIQKSQTEYLGRFLTDGAVELYHNNNKKIETTSTGATVTGNITVTGTVDGVDIATDVARKDGTNMGATTFTVNDADFIVRDSTDSTTNYIWRDHSDSKLYLGTGAAVVTPRSSVIPQADSTYNLGTSSVRWANVYADTLYGDGSNLTGVNPTIADNCIYENEDVISSTVSTTSGKNAMSAGPIQITGTLTVADNTTYTII